MKIKKSYFTAYIFLKIALTLFFIIFLFISGPLIYFNKISMHRSRQREGMALFALGCCFIYVIIILYASSVPFQYNPSYVITKIRPLPNISNVPAPMNAYHWNLKGYSALLFASRILQTAYYKFYIESAIYIFLNFYFIIVLNKLISYLNKKRVNTFLFFWIFFGVLSSLLSDFLITAVASKFRQL